MAARQKDGNTRHMLRGNTRRVLMIGGVVAVLETFLEAEPGGVNAEIPEPTDYVWGLKDRDSQPVDNTFVRLRADRLDKRGAVTICPG